MGHIGSHWAEKTPMANSKLNVPGASLRAMLMLPFRGLAFAALFVPSYPLFLTIAWARALYIRLVVGAPSKALAHGSRNRSHDADQHYPNIQVYSQPLDETRLRPALVQLASEDGIEESAISLRFFDEEPQDWPAPDAEPGGGTGSYNIDHFIRSLRQPSRKRRYSIIDHFLLG